MAYKIAIASGKGGTGKTSVSVSLYKLLNKHTGNKVHLVDCDVEEPNDILFFGDSTRTMEKSVTQLIPVIDKNKCTFCRKCSEYCEFNAIVVIPPVQFAEVNPSLCHSCGACIVACKHNAISEHPDTIGKINYYRTTEFDGITEGKLKIGSAMQTMLIKKLKKNVSAGFDLIIYDAPPGTSCSVVETMSNVNFVVLVAEPTPFGLHDLKLMVELVRSLELPHGVIINKAGLGSTEIYNYLQEEDIQILGEIPFSREYAALYADGRITEAIPESIQNSYSELLKVLNEKIAEHEGNNYFKW